jgi:WhiB family redox-sensing transcriptional regulator
MTVDVSWRELAACKDEETVLFFGVGDDEPQKDRLEREAAAIAICRRCPVREKCLHEALVNKEQGIWGGYTKWERKKMLRKERYSQRRRETQGLVIRKIVAAPSGKFVGRVLEVRKGWDGEDVLIRTEDYGQSEFGLKWIVEKSGQVVYETKEETDAWLMFASWTVTF